MLQIRPHQICKNCLRTLFVGSKQFMRTKWTAATVRQSFIDFFCQNHDHTFVRSSPVIPYKDQGTYFTNAGMNQFRPLFLGTVDKNHPMADYKRVVNSQKCVRVGGKHNDLEDVGKDLYHHTFFEMLGSWSFGDYFKREACSMALELLTTVYRIPINRLYFTYFGGDNQLGLDPDQQTRDIWRSLGVPVDRIIPCGMKDNFWDMGDTGPCGPCTEIHYDYTGSSDSVKLVNMGSPEVLEIWNLVFMQYNRRTDGSLEPLSKVHVDTGMGLERMLAVMYQTSSTYNTDLFMPTFTAIQKSCNITPYGGQTDNDIDVAYRIIADHIRMASVCIADGLLPGNKHQGHKLRSVLFRCLYQSKKILNMPDGSIPGLVDVVVDSLGETFPELADNKYKIKYIVSESEDWYDKTILIGEKAFQRYLRKYPDQKHLSAQCLMDIVDGRFTGGYSIPVEMLPNLGTLYNVTLDMEDLHHLIENNQKVSEQQVKDTERVICSPETLREVAEMGVKPTDDSQKYNYTRKENVYYFPQETKAVITNIIKDDSMFTVATGTGDFGILLDKTLFYGEGGGQAADVGYIKSSNGGFKVCDVQIHEKYVLHIGNMEFGKLEVGDSVTLNIDQEHRLGCMRNHTATHILNTSLRRLYKNVSQQGSRIYPDKFSFSFSSTTKMRPEDLIVIQDQVQDAIESNLMVHRGLLPLDVALQIPNLISLKNEEYPGEVFTVSLVKDMDTFSTELCGGIHVTCTSDMEAFCIISASLSPQGIKRLICLTGTHAKKAIDRGMKTEDEYKQLESMIRSETNPESWLDRLKYIKKELEKDMPKPVFDDLRRKVDRLGEPMKMGLNKIKKEQLRKVISAKLQDSRSTFCQVSTDISVTPQVMNQVLLDIKPRRPVVVVSIQDKTAPVFVCISEDLKLEDSLEKGLQRNHDSKIKMKKTLKQNLVFLTFTSRDKSLDKTSAVCGQLEKALS